MSTDFRRTYGAAGLGRALQAHGLRVIERVMHLNALGRRRPREVPLSLTAGPSEASEGLSPCCGVMPRLKLIVDQHQFWRCSRCGEVRVALVDGALPLAAEPIDADAGVW